MKILNHLKSLIAAGGVIAALCSVSVADVIPVKPEDGSRHFAAVSKHLELGGLFFSYADIDGDLASLASFGDRLLNLARKENLGIPKELSATKIVDALGLTCVKALGASSRVLGKDLYHNRALIYMPDGPKGLMKLFGGKPAAYQIAAFAPGDSGLAGQMDITLSALLETAEAVIKATGDNNALNQYKASLSFPVPALNMSVGDLISKLNTRVMVTARFEDGKKLTIPGAPFDVPGIRLMIALDDIDFVMQPLLAMLGESDAAAIEKGDGFTVIRPTASLPGDLDYFRPALYHDHKNKRIILTSHLDLAKSAGRGDTLAGNAGFKKAMEGLPAEGNGLSYVTPEFMKTFLDFYRGVVRQMASTGGAPAGIDEIMNRLFDLIPIPSIPVAGVYANVPDGMLFISNDTGNYKHAVEMIALVPAAALVAGAASGYRGVVEGARARAEQARKNAAPDEPGGDETPAKAIQNNLQQIAFSAQTYFIDNPKEKTVTYEALVKSELIFELDPVDGESYKGLTLKRAGGALSVKTKGGDSIKFKYPATTD